MQLHPHILLMKKNWNTIWSMKIPNKVKNFLWKCYVDAIPCCYELWKKKVRKNPYCLVCGERNEIIEHVLLLCEWTRGVWFSVCSGLKVDKNNITRFDVWLQKVMEGFRGDKNEREIMLIKIALTCWNVWKERCEVVFTRRKVQVDGVIGRIRRG